MPPFLFLVRFLSIWKDIAMQKALGLVGLSIVLSACGPHDRCTAPAQPKLMSVKDMSLIDKANALGVPPDHVPEEPKSASSYGALLAGAADNARAQSVYDAYVARKNAAFKIQYCVDNEAYKARTMKDEMGSLAHAVMATCQSQDEPAALAAVLKYRNCAAGQ
jgi:hypothetical protein